MKYEHVSSSLPSPLPPSLIPSKSTNSPSVTRSPAMKGTATTTLAGTLRNTSSVTVVAQATTTKPPSATTSTDTTVSRTVKPVVHTGESATGESETVLSAAAITGFKCGGSRPRRATKGARSGLKNHRTQQPDTNIWKQLLEKRQGYSFAARVLGRILDWARRHQKQEVGENKSETTEQRAILE